MADVSLDNGDGRWVVYATFSATGRPAPHAAEQIDAYMALGFQVAIIDASPEMSAERAEDWHRRGAIVLRRANVGYDFGSYAAGAAAIRERLGGHAAGLRLILTNDSCFGPFFPIGDVLAGFDARPADPKLVFGMTDSFETGTYHLQSYWLYFRPDVSDLALQFLREMKAASNRAEAIRCGELALSAFLLERGCRLQACAPIDSLVRRCARRHGTLWSILELSLRRKLKRYRYTRRGDGACLKYLLRRPGALNLLNPTLDLARALYAERLIPFVKVALLRENSSVDPALPRATRVDGLTNRDVAALLESYRPPG